MNKFVWEIKELPYEEFEGWCEYFQDNPVGLRDDMRAYALMSAWGVKEPFEKVFPNSKSMRQKTVGESLVGSSLFSKMQGARGGDKIAI